VRDRADFFAEDCRNEQEKDADSTGSHSGILSRFPPALDKSSLPTTHFVSSYKG
jgi:hypothetical protein